MAAEAKPSGRVCMVGHAVYLFDARIRRQAEFLAEQGYETHVVCCRNPLNSAGRFSSSYDSVNGVHIHNLPISKKRGNKLRYIYEFVVFTILSTVKVALMNLRKRFQVVHIHNMPDILVLAGLIPKVTGSVVVLDVHDPMSELFQETYRFSPSHPVMRILKLQERLSYRMADRLMTVSIPMAENVARKRDCPPGTVMVIHNFPDLRKFPIRENGRPWPINNGEIVFLYTGTVTEHYRLDIAVRAFAKVSESIPNIRFKMLGTGNCVEEMLGLAKKLGIGDRVEYLKPVDQEKVKDVVAQADVGISTHQSGIFGELYFSTKIIEFMTQGLPVLSSRTYTLEQYIPEDSIFFFEPQNVDDLVENILFICRNPAIVRERIENSKKILSKYTWQSEQNRFLSFYESLVL